MCKSNENKHDIMTGVSSDQGIGACGGTCPAFKKHGECPRVLKEMRKQQAKMVAKMDIAEVDMQVDLSRADVTVVPAAALKNN